MKGLRKKKEAPSKPHGQQYGDYRGKEAWEEVEEGIRGAWHWKDP